MKGTVDELLKLEADNNKTLVCQCSICSSQRYEESHRSCDGYGVKSFSMSTKQKVNG